MASADVWQDRTFSFLEEKAKTRTKKSDADKAEDAMSKLTKAERDAIFAKYN